MNRKDAGVDDTLRARQRGSTHAQKEARDAGLDETLADPSRSHSAAVSRETLDRDGNARGGSAPAAGDFAELGPVDPDNYAAGPELARGGMGRIVRARDRRLGREVAIKELIDDTPERRLRFEREAFITARLQHPAIVNIHEAGRWPSGEPFYAMKLVAGRSLEQILDATPSFSERFALLPNLIAVVEALAYAHRQRIIHRDLKPANVLVGEFGETVVIDWGLAKNLAEAEPAEAPTGAAEPPASAEQPPRPAASRSGSRDSSLTVVGAIIGTPTYMAPEQAHGEEVDERADVYALGAILYHLLTGTTPYDGRTVEEILAKVVDDAPAPIADLQPRVPPDLQTIITKAMARDTDARYANAGELAEDLRRFRTGQLVAAHAYSAKELLGRWIARHRAAVVASAVAVIAIAVIGAVSFQRIVTERDRARAAQANAAARADEITLSRAREDAARNPLAALRALSTLPLTAPPRVWRAARTIAAGAALSGIPQIIAHAPGPIPAMAVTRRGLVVAAAADDSVRAWRLTGGAGRVLGRQGSAITSLRVSRDGRWAVTSGIDGTVRLWDLESGTSRQLRGHRGMVSDTEWSPDGRTVFSIASDGTVRAWDRTSGKGRILRRHQGMLLGLAVSPDGVHIAASAQDNTLELIDRRDGSSQLLAHQRINTLEFGPKDKWLAGIDFHGKAKLWNLSTDAPRAIPDDGDEVKTIAFSPDGSLLARAGEDGVIRLLSLAGGKPRTLRGRDDSSVYQLVFSADGKLLASSSRDHTVRVWKVADGTTTATLRLSGSSADKTLIAFTPHAGALVVALAGTIERWNFAGGAHAYPGGSGIATTIAATRNGRWVAAGWQDGSVRLVDVDAGTSRPLAGMRWPPAFVAVSAGGDWVAAASEAWRIRLWNAHTGAGHDLTGAAMGRPVFSPNGRIIAAPGRPNVIRLWDTRTHRSRILRGDSTWVSAVAFSPDGARLASAAADGEIRLWDMRTGKGRVLGRGGGRRFGLAFDARGDHLVAAGDGGVVVWNLSSGGHRQLAHGWVDELTVGGTAPWVAWRTGKDVSLHVWDGEAGRTLRLANSGGARAIALSGDGGHLVAASDDGVRVWDTTTGGLLLLATNSAPEQVAVSDHGRVIAAAYEGAIRVWRDTVPAAPAALSRWLRRVVANHSVSPRRAQRGARSDKPPPPADAPPRQRAAPPRHDASQ